MRYNFPWLLVVTLAIYFVWVSGWLISASAAERCTDWVQTQANAKKNDIQIIKLNNEVFRFLQGVWAMNPQTPPGFPFGTAAVAIHPTKIKDAGYLIAFVDGNRVCDGMPAPKALWDMISEIMANIPHHEPKGT